MDVNNFIQNAVVGATIVLIVGLCLVLINIIVFVKFILMMEDVKAIRLIAEKWAIDHDAGSIHIDEPKTK